MLNRCISRNTRLPVNLRIVSRFYSDGPLGGAGPGNPQDIFIKRERAKEDYYARQQEREQLAHVKEQLKEHKKKLENLENKLITFQSDWSLLRLKVLQTHFVRRKKQSCQIKIRK